MRQRHEESRHAALRIVVRRASFQICAVFSPSERRGRRGRGEMESSVSVSAARRSARSRQQDYPTYFVTACFGGCARAVRSARVTRDAPRQVVTASAERRSLTLLAACGRGETGDAPKLPSHRQPRSRVFDICSQRASLLCSLLRHRCHTEVGLAPAPCHARRRPPVHQRFTRWRVRAFQCLPGGKV